MSDSPTHFRNQTLQLLATGMRTKHHFTLPYCPWSNGAVERLGKELLRASRAILSEAQLPLNTWPDIIPVLQSALNNSTSPHRNHVSPLQAFTGRKPAAPILTFLRSETATPVTLSEAQYERSTNIQQLQEIMENLHPLIASTLTENRRRIRELQAKGTMKNFLIGDFVIFARAGFFKGEKL